MLIITLTREIKTTVRYHDTPYRITGQKKKGNLEILSKEQHKLSCIDAENAEWYSYFRKPFGSFLKIKTCPKCILRGLKYLRYLTNINENICSQKHQSMNSSFIHNLQA